MITGDPESIHSGPLSCRTLQPLRSVHMGLYVVTGLNIPQRVSNMALTSLNMVLTAEFPIENIKKRRKRIAWIVAIFKSFLW